MSKINHQNRKLDLQTHGGNLRYHPFGDMASQRKNPREKTNVRSHAASVLFPMGLPNEFVIEFFAPTLDEYEVFHNLDADTDDPGAASAQADPR